MILFILEEMDQIWKILFEYKETMKMILKKTHKKTMMKKMITKYLNKINIQLKKKMKII